MDASTLAALAAIVLSLVCSYVPSSDGWWEGLTDNKRRLVMLGFLFVVALGSVGVACTGLAALLGMTITCDTSGFLEVLKAFIAAAIANQTTFKLTPKTSEKVAASVLREKEARAEAKK